MRAAPRLVKPYQPNRLVVFLFGLNRVFPHNPVRNRLRPTGLEADHRVITIAAGSQLSRMPSGDFELHPDLVHPGAHQQPLSPGRLKSTWPAFITQANPASINASITFHNNGPSDRRAPPKRNPANGCCAHAGSCRCRRAGPAMQSRIWFCPGASENSCSQRHNDPRRRCQRFSATVSDRSQAGFPFSDERCGPPLREGTRSACLKLSKFGSKLPGHAGVSADSSRTEKNLLNPEPKRAMASAKRPLPGVER